MSVEQLYLRSKSGDGSLPEVDQGKAKNARNEGVGLSSGEGQNQILVTVVIKQLGFYGSQSQFTVDINPHSHLLRALDKERVGGKEVTEHVLVWLSKSVLSAILPLVSGIPEARSPSRSRPGERGAHGRR